MKWKTVYDAFINILHFAINAEVEYMSAPSLGMIIIHSKKHLYDKDVEPFGLTLSTEKSWLPGEYVYSSCLSNESADKIIKWGKDNYDSWINKA